MPLYSAQRRDGNEREIITALDHVGAAVFQMDKSAGFDLLVAYRGRLVALEVKRPGERLTDNERKVLARIIQHGDNLAYVVETAEEALQAIGVGIW